MNKLEQYIEEYSSVGTKADNALLAELDRATNLREIQPKMVSGRVQGAFLTLITRMLRPQLVLEIGTFTGYSALSIAAGLGEDNEEFQIVAGLGEDNNELQTVTGLGVRGNVFSSAQGSGESKSEFPIVAGSSKSPEIHTVEIDDELEEIASEFFARSPHGHRIHLHIGSALEVVPKLAQQLGQPFDMVFIDGDKREYPAYYQMLMGDYGSARDTKPAPMVRSGTIILTDNVLWYGKVAEPNALKQADRMSQGIMEFNRMVATDPRVENVILPLRDGINLIRVK